MTCCDGNILIGEPNGTYDSDRIAEEQLLATSVDLEDGLRQIEFSVPDMHCVACIGSIERGLSGILSVNRVRANLSSRKVMVIWNTDIGSALEIDQQLDALGFSHSPFDRDDEASDVDVQRGQKLLLSLVVAGFAAANIMLLSVSVWSGADQETAQLFHLISGLICVPAIGYAGQPFFKSAWSALRVGRLNMDVPISLAVLLALGMSCYESLTGGEEAYFDAAVTLLFFLLIGRYLDHLMREKARGAVARLSQLSARGAVVIEADGRTRYMPTDEIEPGMRLRINAGARFPVNATIVSGSSELDRSLVSGESNSVLVEPGTDIEAGTLNLTAQIEIEATSNASGSFLAEMQQMMEAAENGRGTYVGIADRMARIYAPAVHLLALATFVFWMVHSSGDVHTALYTAIAVLIITCPCALGLAVPVAHVIAANRLMRDGILMRDGTALERLAEIDTAVFDKTGTLTMGKPEIRNAGKIDKQHAPFWKALADGSNHPFAKAVSELLCDVEAKPLTTMREIPGYGVEAEFDGKRIRFGKPDWVAELSRDDADQAFESAVAFAIEDGQITQLELSDTLRPEALPTLKRLAARGVAIEILSGDNTNAVSRVARKLNLAEWQAEKNPAEKIARLNELKNNGHTPLMIGDGLNDAPALANAHVSMAPASACDVGRLAADFVFTSSSLSAVNGAYGVALKTLQIVRQNFCLALAYNCIAVPLAMAGFVTPLIAAIAMSTSSILVITNSMRIETFKKTISNQQNAAGSVIPSEFREAPL